MNKYYNNDLCTDSANNPSKPHGLDSAKSVMWYLLTNYNLYFKIWMKLRMWTYFLEGLKQTILKRLLN